MKKKQFQAGCRGGSIFGGTAELWLKQRGEGTMLDNLGMAGNFNLPWKKNSSGKEWKEEASGWRELKVREFL